MYWLLGDLLMVNLDCIFAVGYLLDLWFVAGWDLSGLLLGYCGLVFGLICCDVLCDLCLGCLWVLGFSALRFGLVVRAW